MIASGSNATVIVATRSAQNELLIKNEANQNRNKKVSFVLPVGKANFLTQFFFFKLGFY